MVVVSTTTTMDREKNRHRSISTSSTSSLTNVTISKKRQLNFEQELSKDLIICSSKHRRDDGNGSNLSSTVSSKKRRESSCGGGSSRSDESRLKHKSTTPTNLNTCDNNNKKSHTSTTGPIVQNSAELNVYVATTSAAFAPTPSETSTACADTRVTITRDALPQVPVYPSNATAIQNVPTTLALPAGAGASIIVPTTAISPVSCVAATHTTTLPYYNTIYGKLLDNTQSQQQVSHSAISSSAEIDVNNSLLTMVTTTATSSLSTTTISAVSPLLSDYMDTKAKSFNALGGYVSHTAQLFGLNAVTKVSTSTSNDTDATTDMQITTPTMVTPTISPVAAKLPTPMKILTKTASHDPRLNPILTAPEPPPAPKRKLSINEYRKRKQQTTGGGSDNNITSSTNNKEKITTKYTINNFAAAFATNSPPNNNTYVSTMNKCTLNSPERSFEMVNRDIHEKSLNESLLSNSRSSYGSVDMSSCLRIGEEDTSKVQFSAAPTLLEKQQENLCERLKSLKNKQSAADLVTGRLSSISNEFGLKKDNDLFFNRSSTSDLDNCLEAISSSSNSMTSSRESTPERHLHDKDMHLNNRNYNETTTSKGEIINSAVSVGAYHHYSASGNNSGSGSAGETAQKRNYDLA